MYISLLLHTYNIFFKFRKIEYNFYYIKKITTFNRYTYVLMADIGQFDVLNNSVLVVKEYKTKDYVRRAKQKYRNRKYSEDEEYRANHKAKSKEWYNKNKSNDTLKEKRALYMKEYRARKKREKEQAKLEQSTESSQKNVDTVVDSINTLSIKN